MVSDSEAREFLDLFADTGDWAIWGALSDRFAEESDDAGEVFAREMLAKKRRPFRYQNGYYYWSWSSSDYPMSVIGPNVGNVMNILKIPNGGDSISECYLGVLACFRHWMANWDGYPVIPE